MVLDQDRQEKGKADSGPSGAPVSPGAVNAKQRTGDFHVATSLSPPVAFLLLKKKKPFLK